MSRGWSHWGGAAMDGAPTWMLSWIVVVAIGLSPILVVFIWIVLRRKLVVHQRSGGCPPAEMTEEDEAGNLPVGQTPQHGPTAGRTAYLKALKVSDAGSPAVKQRTAAKPTLWEADSCEAKG